MLSPSKEPLNQNTPPIETTDEDELAVEQIVQSLHLPSLDLAYDEAKRIVDLQFTQIDALDVKVSIVIAACGVILSILLAGLPAAGQLVNATVVALVIADIGCGLVAAVLGVAALVFGKYYNVPSIDRLVEKYLVWKEVNTKYQLLFEFQNVTEYNKKAIRLKVLLGWASVIAFLLSFALSSISILYLLYSFLSRPTP